MRIEQFNDNKTEQVWELFKNEFQDASRQLGRELWWMLVSGGLSCRIASFIPLYPVRHDCQTN